MDEVMSGTEIAGFALIIAQIAKDATLTFTWVNGRQHVFHKAIIQKSYRLLREERISAMIVLRVHNPLSPA